MTTEEFRESAARALEADANVRRKSYTDQQLEAGGYDYALGRIAGLKEAAAIVRSHPVASPWIPVGERLPEDGATVLVASRFGVRIMSVAQCHHNHDPEDDTTDVRWYVDGEGETFPAFWMPRPEPPTESTS